MCALWITLVPFGLDKNLQQKETTKLESALLSIAGILFQVAVNLTRMCCLQALPGDLYGLEVLSLA